jgi:hypothetical protein
MKKLYALGCWLGSDIENQQVLEFNVPSLRHNG